MSRAAVVQLTSGDDVGANLARAGDLVAEAARAGARLVVLPENFAWLAGGDSAAAKRAIAERDGAGPIQDAVAGWARAHRTWIVAGTLPIIGGDDPRPAAACLVYDADGARVARYDKVHLFDVDVPGGERHRESATTRPGDALVAVETPIGVLGLTVCYDLRFPEQYRALVDLGATAFAVPAAFTAVTGAAHWETLLRARAIEDQCWVLAAAQWGMHPSGRRTHGDAMIVDPWGAVVARLPEGEGFVVADLPGERVGALRRGFPVLDHRGVD